MTPEVVEALKNFAGGLQQLTQMAQPQEMPAAERVANAKVTMKAELTGKMATELEACIHCGMCAEACHFQVATGDPKYTPISKLDLLKRVYRREMSPLRWLYRATTRDITAEDLSGAQELVYDSCTECGRCAMICPMGIDIPSMVAVMRRSLASAALAPPEMQMLAMEQMGRGSVFGIGGDQLNEFVANLEKQGIPVPLNKDKAEILLMSTVIDVFAFHDSLIGMVRILNHMKLDWTLCSDGFEGANFGMLAGDENSQKIASERVINAATRVGAKLVITPECGHAYPALRFEAPDVHGGPLPFEVVTVSEFIGREIEAGRLKLQPSGEEGPIVYHDPCKHNRHGGVHEEPRTALRAMGYDLRETKNSGALNYCCGGGAGVMVVGKAALLRRKAFRLKREQVEDTGAEAVVTACGSCRVQFGINAVQTGWTVDIKSLSSVAADHLEGVKGVKAKGEAP